MNYKLKVYVNYNGDDAMLYSMIQKHLVDDLEDGYHKSINMNRFEEYDIYDSTNI